MPLTLSKSCIGGTFLLLLLSNLLLWEEVASEHMQDGGQEDQEEKSLEDLFDHAVTLSQNISVISREMRKTFFYNDFSSNKFHKIVLRTFKDQQFVTENLKNCHTFSLTTPETKEEAKSTSLEDFLKIILSILRAWNDPLHHLVREVSGMPGAPDEILSRAKNIEAQNKGLQAHIRRMLSKVHPGIEENTIYPFWPDLPSLSSTDEDIQFLALYKLCYCLLVDTDRVDIYLNLLKCVLTHGDTCYSSLFSYDS